MVAALVGLAWGLEGKIGAEKALTRVAMPVGIVWLGLSALLLRSLALKRWLDGVAAGTLTCLLWGGSNGLVADRLTAQLESRYPPFQPELEEPLDYLVVLGGGTREGPHRAQAGFAGDRILLGAQLFLSGAAKRLVTTGQSREKLGGAQRGPAEQTVEIWETLGVPKEAIEALPGRNTAEEIDAIAAKMEGPWAGKRVGLLTSALHLPRAMRLAKARGASPLIPIPADFSSVRHGYSVVDVLPSAEALWQSTRCVHEMLARLVSR